MKKIEEIKATLNDIGEDYQERIETDTEVEFTNLPPEEMNKMLEKLFNQNKILFKDNFNLNNIQASGDNKILKKDYKESDKDYSISETALTEIKNLSSKDDMMKKMKELMEEQKKLFEDRALLSGENIESTKQI